MQNKQWKRTIHNILEKADQIEEQKRRGIASLFWDQLIKDLDKE